MSIDYRRITLEDIPAYAAALNAVIAERAFLGSVDERGLAETASYVRDIVTRGWPQGLAIEGGAVVGWYDIVPLDRAGGAHVGRLGMGVVAAHRGGGIGSALLADGVERAAAHGFEKIELEVYADNAAARALYAKFGFVTEGCRRRARKLDGRYQDIVLMARFAADG